MVDIPEPSRLGLDKSRSTGAVALGPWFGTTVLRRECCSTMNSVNTTNLMIYISYIDKLVIFRYFIYFAKRSEANNKIKQARLTMLKIPPFRFEIWLLISRKIRRNVTSEIRRAHFGYISSLPHDPF